MTTNFEIRCLSVWERAEGKKGKTCDEIANHLGEDGIYRCTTHNTTHRMKLYTNQLKAELRL